MTYKTKSYAKREKVTETPNLPQCHESGKEEKKKDKKEPSSKMNIFMQCQSLQTRNGAKQNRISVWPLLALTLKTSVEVQHLYCLPNKSFLILKHMLEIGKFGQEQKEKRGVGGQ